eukprot:CAMPEP_0174834866 /NCGR_PEP_ID=MMETSP1114-20130205/5092_1 /TAXON_ID=312471 /ORGANISM="Neobodo designis, Strain CCAP 1951/1" /LENGTH=685 /DNA_ID=CAMNT_0016068795 /DNA_START=37 /DNA_END=2094 /DNA_ORIENTATION=-
MPGVTSNRLFLRSTHGEESAGAQAGRAGSNRSGSTDADSAQSSSGVASSGASAPSSAVEPYRWELKRLRTLGKGSYGVAILVEVVSEPPGWFPSELRHSGASPRDRRTSTRPRLVVKEINLSACPADARDSIFREIRILKTVQHPNVVQYVDSTLDIDTNRLFILMEYCDGGDVASLIDAANRRRPMRGVAEEEIWALLVQVLMALRCLHLEHRVIHRDLKPQNIFLTSRGVVKVGDFGVSAVLSQTVDFARTFVGSPHYLAPEVVEQRPYNGKADMWSLGCVLYECMAYGERVFDGSNLVAVLSDIVCSHFKPIDEVVDCLGAGEILAETAERTAFGPELRRVVCELLQADPEKRASVTRLLRMPQMAKRASSLLPRELRDSKPYIEQFRASNRRVRGPNETPLAFGGGDTWSEAVASRAASPVARRAQLRRVRSDAHVASPAANALPAHAAAPDFARTADPNQRLKLALEARRTQNALNSQDASPALQPLHRAGSGSAAAGGAVMFPRDSPMIPVFGNEFASENASPAGGSFRRPGPRRMPSFERSDDGDNPLMHDISDLIPENADPTAVIADAERALRASEAATSATDSDHSDEAVEYTDDFDSTIDSADGQALEAQVYNSWACPRIDLGFRLDEHLTRQPDRPESPLEEPGATNGGKVASGSGAASPHGASLESLLTTRVV